VSRRGPHTPGAVRRAAHLGALRLALLSLAVTASLAGPVDSGVAAAPPVATPTGAATPIPQRPDRSRVTFLGWSPDGRYVAYRRERWQRPRYPGGRVRYRDRTLHREVRAAKLRGYGPPLRPDPASYLAAHGYTNTPLARERQGPRSFTFQDAQGRAPLRLEMVPGARLAWRVSRGDAVLVTRPFDRLYVAWDAQAFRSPRGDTLALVLTLDTGWRVDAALYLVPLGE